MANNLYPSEGVSMWRWKPEAIPYESMWEKKASGSRRFKRVIKKFYIPRDTTIGEYTESWLRTQLLDNGFNPNDEIKSYYNSYDNSVVFEQEQWVLDEPNVYIWEDGTEINNPYKLPDDLFEI